MQDDITNEAKAELRRFITNLLVTVMCMVCLGAFALHTYQASRQVTLASTQMEDRAWSISEVDKARAISHKQLKSLSIALDNASKKGDLHSAMQIASATTPVLRSWNDQSQEIKHLGRMCLVAAFTLSRAADAVAIGQTWSYASIEQALAECNP